MRAWREWGGVRKIWSVLDERRIELNFKLFNKVTLIPAILKLKSGEIVDYKISSINKDFISNFLMHIGFCDISTNVFNLLSKKRNILYKKKTI